MVHGENYQDFKINKTKIIMSIPCQTYVQVVQSEDLCNGETKPNILDIIEKDHCKKSIKK